MSEAQQPRRFLTSQKRGDLRREKGCRPSLRCLKAAVNQSLDMSQGISDHEQIDKRRMEKCVVREENGWQAGGEQMIFIQWSTRGFEMQVWWDGPVTSEQRKRMAK